MGFYLVLGSFIVVFVSVVIVLVYGNAKKSDTLAKLDAQKEALTMLAHAQEYLTPLGSGHNLEYTNARAILENAMYNVLYS